MRQNYIVEMEDGTVHEIESDARDIRKWEATYGKSFMTSELSFTEVAQVAYIAGRRTGVLNGTYPTYDAFDAACVDARGKTVAGATQLVGDPTRPVPTGT